MDHNIISEFESWNYLVIMSNLKCPPIPPYNSCVFSPRTSHNYSGFSVSLTHRLRLVAVSITLLSALGGPCFDTKRQFPNLTDSSEAAQMPRVHRAFLGSCLSLGQAFLACVCPLMLQLWYNAHLLGTAVTSFGVRGTSALLSFVFSAYTGPSLLCL